MGSSSHKDLCRSLLGHNRFLFRTNKVTKGSHFIGFLQAHYLCLGLCLRSKYTVQSGLSTKKQHIFDGTSLVAFAQSFKPEDFDKLAINALSAITLEIESDH